MLKYKQEWSMRVYRRALGAEGRVFFQRERCCIITVLRMSVLCSRNGKGTGMTGPRNRRERMARMKLEIIQVFISQVKILNLILKAMDHHYYAYSSKGKSDQMKVSIFLVPNS